MAGARRRISKRRQHARPSRATAGRTMSAGFVATSSARQTAASEPSASTRPRARRRSAPRAGRVAARRRDRRGGRHRRRAGGPGTGAQLTPEEQRNHEGRRDEEGDHRPRRSVRYCRDVHRPRDSGSRERPHHDDAEGLDRARGAGPGEPARDGGVRHDLALAKKDGYGVITQMIPDMGSHFLNLKVAGFDVKKPAISCTASTETRGSSSRIVGLPTKRPKPPLPGATYGSFGAACHYKEARSCSRRISTRAPRSPRRERRSTSGVPTWSRSTCRAWYLNPDGMFSGMNH